MGMSVICKRNRVSIFCRLSTMHECDRQTDRQTDYGMVTSIAIGKIACQRCRLKWMDFIRDNYDKMNVKLSVWHTTLDSGFSGRAACVCQRDIAKAMSTDFSWCSASLSRCSPSVVGRLWVNASDLKFTPGFTVLWHLHESISLIPVSLSM